MPKYDESRVKKISAELSVGESAVTDLVLIDKARNYKKFIASRYRLINEGDIQHLSGDRLFASTKLDGQLHFLYKDADECFLFNVKGRVIAQLPLFDELKQRLKGLDQVMLAGELYFYQGENRSRVYDVTSALGQSGGDRVGALRFAVFDILEIGGQNANYLSVEEKSEQLSGWFPDEGPVHRIVPKQCDAGALSKLYNDVVVNQGHEGLVCIDDSNHTVYKIKPRHNVDVVILGFTESPDAPDTLRVLLTGLMRPDGSFQVFAKVGTGFDDEQRREFYRLLKPMAVPSSFNTTDRNHTLFTMVRPEVIIEMAFHDLIYENPYGRPEMKTVLKYDSKTGFEACLPEPFVSALGPVFKRIRDDKEVKPSDLRLTQIADFVDLSNLEDKSRSQEYAQSTVLKREVYTKVTKGLVSVRKFIAWKTNKDDIDADYPAYAFCYVDYSPGRKDPMKKVVRIAPSEASITAIYNQFLESEVKKGWKPTE